MLQITLELKNNEDEALLLTLLQRLGISYLILKKGSSGEDSLNYHRQIIERGVDFVDFDDVMKDFEQSRKDRNLPFRSE